MVGLRVDDLYVAGDEEFRRKVSEPFVFGKEETKKFRFTGLVIEQTANGIEVNQAK